jgi:prevent-host-death family protein
MKNITASTARRLWSQLLGRVEHRGSRYAIMRNGHVVAALIPIDETDLLRELEDHVDLQQAREAIEQERGKERLSWSEVLAYGGIEE